MNWRDKVVLIVEDEKQMANLLATVFGREGATVHCAGDGEEALGWLDQQEPDLILLDIYMPGIDGVEVLKSARRFTDVPLVILTAASKHELLIESLHAGADDFLRKPIKNDELLARSWAAVRRGLINRSLPALKTYNDGYLAVDLEAQTVEVQGQRIKLTATEFALLAYLLLRSGRVCTFEQILNGVWADDERDSADVVLVFVWKVRQKIEPDPKRPVYLRSQNGFGYRFEGQPQASI
jgi:DNA-binding response OmpR family regulator